VAAADRLSQELGLSATSSAILARRGHRDPEEARRFLRADDRHDPSAFAGMEVACRLILDHVERGSRIVVHGDYDVDGVCSTAIVVRALRALGADPGWRLPNRAEEGYGLTPGTVERLAGDGAELVITTDCGITSAAEVELLKARGIDVVVTDHHRASSELPGCPVVHPALDGYPFPDLCAAGVAHKVAEALYLRAGRDPRGADDDMDLVGLATVADLVPMAGENRRLVREGLVAMARTRKPGLRALLKISGAERSSITEHALGFRLAPRLNAAGRIGRPDAALELLLTEDPARAERVADELDLLNRERRDVETRILFAAEAARSEQADQPAYVLAGDGWHPGVIGIVASRMVERHHRPCVLVALFEGGGRGSGRSISPYDLHAGLTACAPHLRRYGGHRMAAGLEIDRDRIDGFRAAFVAHAAAALSPEDLVPVQRVDALVPGSALGLDLAEELEGLGPFGPGNPRPTLLVPGARVGAVAGMGEEGQHARFTVTSGGARARAVAFRTSARELTDGGSDAPQDVAVTLEANEWNGAVEPRLVLRSLAPTRAGPCTVMGEEPEFWPAVARHLDGELFEPGPQPRPGGGRHRALRDRRDAGIAGVAGELLSSGEPVMLVCADVPRRRAGVEALIAGLTGSGEASRPPALVSWAALARDPALAVPFAHLVAIDPPPLSHGVDLLVSAAGVLGPPGFAHLAWGRPEAEFALAVARAELDCRDTLAALYRGLRGHGRVAGEELERLLTGGEAHPRPAASCARLLLVLVELGVIRLDRSERERLSCEVVEAPRTELERSPTYRAVRGRLLAVEDYLENHAVPAGGGPDRSTPPRKVAALPGAAPPATDAPVPAVAVVA